MKKEKKGEKPTKNTATIKLPHPKKTGIYKVISIGRTDLKINKQYEGETIEMKVGRILSTEGPSGIKGDKPEYYTEKSMGVLPGTDIRHDKWETGTEAMDKIHNPEPYLNAAKIKATAEAAAKEKENNESGETTSTQATETK